MRQPPARFAPIAERDPYPTGRAPAELPGRTGEFGGPERDRTDDIMLAKHALSQLSYRPKKRLPIMNANAGEK